MSISFSLQVAGSAFGDELDAIVAACRKAGDLGFAEIRVADHPGNTWDPFVLLTAIGAQVPDIRLGTYVMNMGVAHPLDVAIAAVTTDAASGGRLTLGIGAGHTPVEWSARGLERPDVDGRVGRFLEVATVLPPLLAGEAIDHRGQHITLDQAQVHKPVAAQNPIPVLIGGSNRRILRHAAAHADIVALTGLGKTRADGHRHDVNFAPERVDATIELINAAAGRERKPMIDVLVQRVNGDDRREVGAAELAQRFEELSTEDALDTPYVLFGSPAFLADQVQGFADRWGIASFTVRPEAIDTIGAVIARLS